METSESPNDICRIYARNFPIRKAGRDDPEGPVIIATIENRHDNIPVCNVKICIRSGQALVFINYRIGHRKFNYVQLTTIDQVHFF